MALRELAVEFRKAGADYLTALQKLGLDPDCLFWAHDEIIDGYVLVLVSPIVDYAGPLELSRTLFKAYNLAATPREIDPFVVRLHSPNQSIVAAVKRALDVRIDFVPIVDPETGHQGAPVKNAAYQISVGGMLVNPTWVYKLAPRKKTTVELSRQWRRFAGNVERLAA